MKANTKFLFAALFCAAGLNAAVIDANKSVAVMPLTITYKVEQNFKSDYTKAESTLKGFAKENSSSSYDNNRDGDRFSSNYHNASDRNLDGNYDLHGKDEKTKYSYNDMNITERKLDTETYTGIIESALSEAGIEVADRDGTKTSNTSSTADIPTVTITGDTNATVDTNATEPTPNPEAQEDTQAQNQVADYVLTGYVNSARLDGIKKVPDGTDKRYSVRATVKISIKITDAQSKKSKFAKTFTGVGTKTFNIEDSVPAAEAMDAAVDDVASQLTLALVGKKKPNPSESDDEYQDSPGKRLRN